MPAAAMDPAAARDEETRFVTTPGLLVRAAESFGWSVTARSGAYTTLARGDEKINVTRGRAGLEIWCDVRSPKPGQSTVLHLVQRELEQSGRPATKGHARVVLRQLAGAMPIAPAPAAIKSAPPIDFDALAAAWGAMPPYAGAYLGGRGLEHDTIAHFGVRQDARGNACFAHRDADGRICGWEAKNTRWHAFATGGKRAIGIAPASPEFVTRVIVAEAFIDAASFAQMHGREGDLYASTGGAIGNEVRQAIKALLARHPGGAELVLAQDADQAGDAMASEIEMMAPGGMRVNRARPGKKDWNDELRVARKEAA